MARSMTGFGAGGATVGGERISVEIRAVNHKFCEVKARLPRELLSLEPGLIERIRARVTRGAIDVSVHHARGQGSAAVPRVDLGLAREYAAAFREMSSALGLTEPLSARTIFEAEGVVRLEERPADLAAAGQALGQAADQALEALVAMRAEEGRALACDLSQHLDRLRALVLQLRELAPSVRQEERERFLARVKELAAGQPVAPERLAQEVAIQAERADVEEELSRLESHLEQLRQMLASGEAVGRRMDFLIQEVHREINTVGSKSQSAPIATLVVDLKAEAERFREQVQNVE
ncbi:MAG TPA: YicC/YloC family endoribonuclease [Myxococcales bacterium]|nr:YicC/YloC family endoribonuclease [Myxococcales bacterium]